MTPSEIRGDETARGLRELRTNGNHPLLLLAKIS